MSKQLRETDLSEPVSEWLRAQGFEPYVEVPHYGCVIDLIGIRDDGETVEALCVELKMSLSKTVIHQAYLSQLISPCSYAAVASQPRKAGIERCLQLGIGVLRVTDGKVMVVVKPKDESKTVTHSREIAKLREHMEAIDPGGVGGLACIRGEGPAQDVEKAIATYREQHPKATWKELWENIPNQYSSEKSMAAGMRMVRTRRHYAERRKQRKVTP